MKIQDKIAGCGNAGREMQDTKTQDMKMQYIMTGQLK